MSFSHSLRCLNHPEFSPGPPISLSWDLGVSVHTESAIGPGTELPTTVPCTFPILTAEQIPEKVDDFLNIPLPHSKVLSEMQAYS